MIAKWLLPAVMAAQCITASAIVPAALNFALVKRDENITTAEYNCHDNCGQAILDVENESDVCDDEGFLADYDNCLQCSGSDNVDIWQYYGSYLTSAAAACGLSTTPLSGTQSDVGTAIPYSSAASTAAAASATTTGSAASSTATASQGSSASSAASAASTAASTSAAAATATSTSGSESALKLNVVSLVGSIFVAGCIVLGA